MSKVAIFKTSQSFNLHGEENYIYKFECGFDTKSEMIKKIKDIKSDTKSLYKIFSQVFNTFDNEGFRPLIVSKVKGKTLFEIKEELENEV